QRQPATHQRNKILARQDVAIHIARLRSGCPVLPSERSITAPDTGQHNVKRSSHRATARLLGITSMSHSWAVTDSCSWPARALTTSHLSPQPARRYARWLGGSPRGQGLSPMPNAGSRLRFTWLGAPLVVLLSACAIATIPPPDAAEVARLEAAHQRDPNSPSTALALASAYRLTGRADEALPLLEEARAENPGDARVLLLLGTLREEQGDLDDALEAYRAYLEVEKRGRWPTEVARRIRLLQRKVMVAEAKRLVAQEAELADTEPQPGTVAVYPFLYRGN